MKTPLLLLLIHACIFAQTAGEIRPDILTQKKVNYNLNIDDSASNGIVDKMNDYDYNLLALNLMADIEDHVNNKIYWEMHLGMGAGYGFNGDGAKGRLFLGIKYNLFNQKIPLARVATSKINKLKGLLQVKEYKFAAEIHEKCAKYGRVLDKYNNEFFWKRLSVGISFFGNDSSSLDRGRYYLAGRAAPFIGYDFGDKATVQVGYAYIMEYFYFGVSVDISTPVYVFGMSFIEMIREFGNTPKSRGFYY